MRGNSWVLVLLVSSLASGQRTATPKSESSSNIPEPKLLVIDYDACPGKGRSVQNMKVHKNDLMYSSHDKTKLTGTLSAGEMVTIVAGANVTQQPGRALVKYVPPDDTNLPPLKVGDVVLVYGMKSNGDLFLWAKGVWF